MVEKMSVAELLQYAVTDDISDIFITSGCPIMVKRGGVIEPLGYARITPDTAAAMVREIFALAPQWSHRDYEKSGDCDFPVSLHGVGRFRVSAFRQRGSAAATIRVVRPTLPNPEQLGIPRAVLELYQKPYGLILVTGPAGAGKSTTLAALIDQINEHRNCHILTVEEPIEHLHRHKMGLVNQREVGADTCSYAKALRAALHQSPDVLLIDQLRDLDIISTALAAAEAGILVLSTLHAVGTVNAIDRIIDAFPPDRQQQIRVQLSMTLQAVISQRLLPSRTRRRVAIFEIMLATAAVRNMIRASKTHQLEAAIHSGTQQGMQLMDHAIAAALKRGEISRDVAFAHCIRHEALERLV